MIIINLICDFFLVFLSYAIFCNLNFSFPAVLFQVLQGAVRWLLHDPIGRGRHTLDTLALVRFTLIPQRVMDTCVADCADANTKVRR